MAESGVAHNSWFVHRKFAPKAMKRASYGWRGNRFFSPAFLFGAALVLASLLRGAAAVRIRDTAALRFNAWKYTRRHLRCANFHFRFV
jgi:hypothetical protein